MNVVIVDPACFSVPYDHSLCTALATGGCEVTLARSSYPTGIWDNSNYQTTTDFYRLHNRHKRALKAIPLISKAIKSCDHFSSMSRFLADMQRTRPQIIHFEWLPLPMLDCFFLKRLKRIAPLVLTLHNTTLFHNAPTSSLQGIGFQKALDLFDAIIVHTEYSKVKVIEQGWSSPERVTVIPHGVFDYYREMSNPSAPRTAGNNKDVVLFFGNLKPYKGLDTLIKAMALLPTAQLQDSKLVVAGSIGMDVAPLKQLANDLGLASAIEWRLGFLPEESIAPLFESSTLVALPYKEIDQSGVLMTAFAFCKPIVATDVGGIRETLHHGKTGFLVEPDNPKALGLAIGNLLADKDLQKRFSVALEELAQNELAWNSIAVKTQSLYNRLATGRCGDVPSGLPDSTQSATASA